MRMILLIALFFGLTELIAQEDSGRNIFIPNIITPNGDGRNDRFVILDKSSGESLSPEESPSLKVYNRWGKIVFEATVYVNQWDSEYLEEGIYFYILQFEGEEPRQGMISIHR